MKWTLKKAQKLYDMPFFDLIHKAHNVHKKNWKSNEIQISVLCSVKTGGCAENCSYCPQSKHYQTGVQDEALMTKTEILEHAKKAKELGADRFCMGAAWRGPKDDQVEYMSDVISEVKKLGLETCATFGLLRDGQAEKLKEAGLDFYNHNIDSSEDFYRKIITTRKFKDRIDTIKKVQDAGINVCSGGILGMGEKVEDRLDMLAILANMNPTPLSVPINKLIAIPGTPLARMWKIDMFDFVRIAAVARIMMPKSYIRFAAGREDTEEGFQALCFYAGVNSIFYGEKLLTAKNASPQRDEDLLKKLNLSKCSR